MTLSHSFQVTPSEAVKIQKELCKKIKIQPLRKKITLVAGCDLSFSRGNPIAYGAVVILKLPEREVIETVTIKDKMEFPYITGLLAFREIPLLLQAFSKLKTKPQVVVCDGQGIAHPRRMGLASHLGLLLDLPSVGCAKTHYVGDFEDPTEEQWSHNPLMDKGEEIGMVLRTKRKVKPIFLSPGHKIDGPSSMALIKRCTGSYRIPEPTRQAHIWANRFRKEEEVDL